MEAKVMRTGPRGRGIRYVATVLAVALGLSVLLPTMAQAAALCGCKKTGEFVDPARKLPVKGELSPGGAYRLTVTQDAMFVHLHLANAQSGATVKDLQVELARADWGFSPDGTSFMYRGAFRDAEGPNPKFDTIGLWNLKDNRSSFYAESLTAGLDVAFSPHGRWFLVNELLPQNQTVIRVIDAVNGGSPAYSEDFIFSPVTGYPGDKYGTVGLGFSSDDSDRSFVRAYRDLNGQVQLLATNLDTKGTIVSTTVTMDSWWQFSPCGDALGLVTQPDQASVAISMYRTEDGKPVGTAATRWFPTSDSFRLETTTTSHVIIDVTPNDGEKTVVVGDNLASQPCTPAVTLSSLTIAPSSVIGGDANATGTVKLSGNAAAATTVSLSSSDSAAASVPATVTIAAGASSATFPITSKAVLDARSVTVTATVGSTSKSASLAVNPSPNSPLESVSVDPDRVLGGGSTVGTVTLSSPAGAAGSVVTLTNANPTLATVPATITVAAGQLTATFPVSTTGSVRVDSPVRITAAGGGQTRTATMWVLTPDRACNPGTSDPAHETLKIRSFASNDDAGHGVDCVQNIAYKNGITVGAGSTGLPVGSPVTLEFSSRFDGAVMTSPPLGSGGVLAEGVSDYSIIDQSVPDTGEGAYQPLQYSARFNLQQYATGVNVTKRTTTTLRTNVGTPLSITDSVESTNPDAVIWDVDTGMLTAQYQTTVGAHLAIDARVSTVASAYGTGSTAIADFGHTFQAASKPAPGFEGLALTYDVGEQPTNQAPTCQAGSRTTAEDTALVGTVTCTDPERAPLTYTVVAGPTRGTLSSIGADGGFTYTPAANVNGTDSFTVKANDGKADSPVVTIGVTVTPVNDAPTCTNGTATTDAGKAVTGTVTCTDVDGDALSYAVSTAPAKGKATINASTGAFTYTPNAGTTGTDTFKVTASDGKASAVATVSVTVKAATSTAPTRLDQCLNNGWKSYTNPKFANQTSCLVYVVLHLIFG